MPADWRPRVLRHEVLMSNDMSDVAEKEMRQAMEIDPNNDEYKKYLVQALEKNGKRQEANEVLKGLLKDERDPWFAHATLARNYEELGMFDSAIAVMEQFSVTHPGDRRASQYIMQLKAMKEKPADTATADSTTAVPAAGK